MQAAHLVKKGYPPRHSAVCTTETPSQNVLRLQAVSQRGDECHDEQKGKDHISMTATHTTCEAAVKRNKRRAPPTMMSLQRAHADALLAPSGTFPSFGLILRFFASLTLAEIF